MRLFDFANLFNAPPEANGVRWVATRIGDKKFRMHSDDKYLDQINGVVEPDMVRLFESLLRDGDCVLDVGANIGCTSLLFASSKATPGCARRKWGRSTSSKSMSRAPICAARTIRIRLSRHVSPHREQLPLPETDRRVRPVTAAEELADEKKTGRTLSFG